MSRLPRVTGSECVRALERSGMWVERVRGSHHIMKGTEGQFAVVPVHRDEVLGPGLLSKILQSAKLSVSEFLVLLS